MILILILCLISSFVKYKIKKRRDLHVYDYFFFHICYITTFCYFFLFFFRFSNLIQGIKIFDLKVIYYKTNFDINYVIFIVMLLWFLINLRNIIIIYTKITLLKLHYFFLYLSLTKGYNYQNIIYSCCFIENNAMFFFLKLTKKIYLSYKIIFFSKFLLKYGVAVLMLILVFSEIYFNNFVLNYSMILLPFFGLYQLLISVIIFICNNMYYLYDVELTNLIYMYDNSEDYIRELPQHIKIYIEKKLLR